MFQGVVHIAIAPFFGLATREHGDEEEERSESDAAGMTEASDGKSGEVWGWRMIGEGKIRGPS